MIEPIAKAVEQGEYSRLLGLLAQGATEEVDQLTSEMIAETAAWLKIEQPHADRAARVVRFWWLRQIAAARDPTEAREIGERWATEFGKVRPGAEYKLQYELKWEFAAARKAKAGGELEVAAKAGRPVDLFFSEGAQPSGASQPEPGSEPKVAAEPKQHSILDRTLKSTPVELALPGVAGEVQDYYLRTAMQPSQALSLAVGLMVPTVLVCGNVIGPSGPKGCALQQTVMGIAPTSGGKLWAIDVVKECVNKAGAKKLLGPNRFKSGPGLVRWVKENKVSLCVQDEIGAMLKKLGNPKSNPCEVEISERMRELWAMGPESTYNSPVGAAKGDDMEAISDPRLSILGFGVREEFFAACHNDDVANGFLSRMAVFEETEMIFPRTDFAQAEFPWALMDKLMKLHSIKPQRLGWSPAAKELYEAELRRVFLEPDERKKKLWARSPEKIVRAASTFTASEFSTKVELRHMEIAQAIFQRSDRVFQAGIEEADSQRELNHAELRREIVRRIEVKFSGGASRAEIKSSFKHNTKHKAAIDDALQDMLDSGMLVKVPVETGGRGKEVYQVKREG